MASLFAKLPLINLWAWANGNEYTIDDEATVLTAELKKSDIETDKEYTQLFGQKEKVSAKDKKQSFKEERSCCKRKRNDKGRKRNNRLKITIDKMQFYSYNMNCILFLTWRGSSVG